MTTTDLIISVAIVCVAMLAIERLEMHNIDSRIATLDKQISVEEKRAMYLKTCYPAPDYAFVNAAPGCAAFNRIVQGEADANESTNEGNK